MRKVFHEQGEFSFEFLIAMFSATLGEFEDVRGVFGYIGGLL